MRTNHGRAAALTGTALVAVLALTGCSAGDGSSDAIGAPAPQEVLEPGPEVPDPERSEDGRDTGRTSAELTDPAQDPLSTFALDVDTGSYTRFRDAVSRGSSVDPAEVRTEEFVNYFEQDYAAPERGLGVSVDAAVLPFRPEHRLVRVGVSSADVAAVERQDVDLVLVVDCSGSMGDEGKMGTTKAALRTLASSLRPTDRVAMVCYSTRARLVLEPTRAAEHTAVLAAIDALEPQDSTNAAAGLALGYDVAMSVRTEGRMTRVVLVSDGVANVGETDPDGILARISAQARAGVHLVSVGVGIDTYGDHLLEQLADRGDGWHVYVDTQAEAERVFATGLTGSLVVAARDAKAQVTFDPEQVAGYRLLGYENRAVADGDFRNDAVDGGEVFAGHATTALYEVALREGRGSEPFVTATVRYLDESGEPVERAGALSAWECASSLREASPRLRQDLVVALLTDRLRGGPWSRQVSGADLREQSRSLLGVLDGDADVAQLVDLVDRATA